jgi:hypothetical protein
MISTPLYLAIGNKRSRIVETFVSEVRLYRLPPNHMTNVDIAYHLDDYLKALVAALEPGHTKSPALASVAIEHAEQRTRFGYDVRALLTEFGILRATIVEAAFEAASITVEEWDRLVDLVYDSLTQAAAHLVKQGGAREATSP